MKHDDTSITLPENVSLDEGHARNATAACWRCIYAQGWEI
jgi:hypothetical protein